MLKKLDVKTCNNCPHELVTGVACDWRPMDECPYVQPMSSRGHRAQVHFVPLPAPLPSETDAIRSFN